MESPYYSGGKMRTRSGSGVRLDYYQRLVYKTILKYQVGLFGWHFIFRLAHCLVLDG